MEDVSAIRALLSSSVSLVEYVVHCAALSKTIDIFRFVLSNTFFLLIVISPTLFLQYSDTVAWITGRASTSVL